MEVAAGDTVPLGPYRPSWSVQRGTLMYMWRHTGDPLTPGTPAVEGVERLDPARATNLPRIPVIPIGYADGFSRAFSGGVGRVMVSGTLAPVVGNVCMDMTMIDVTDIPTREGDEVVIFGKDLPIQQLARSIGTIPYEILTNTSERVKRVFVAESI